MAKKSQINRDNRRRALVEKHAEKRTELRKRLNDPNVSVEEKLEVQKAFAKLPRNSCPTQQPLCRERPIEGLLPQVRHQPHRAARAGPARPAARRAQVVLVDTKRKKPRRDRRARRREAGERP